MAMAIRDRFATIGDLRYVMDEMRELIESQDNSVGNLWSKYKYLERRMLDLNDDVKFVKGDVQNIKTDIQIIKEQMSALTTVLLNNEESRDSIQANPSPKQDCSSSRNRDISMIDSSPKGKMFWSYNIWSLELNYLTRILGCN